MSEEILSPELNEVQSLRCEIDGLKRELEVMQTDQQERKKREPQNASDQYELKKLREQIIELDRLIDGKMRAMNTDRYIVGTAMFDMLRHPLHIARPLKDILLCIYRKIKRELPVINKRSNVPSREKSKKTTSKKHNNGKRTWIIKCPAPDTGKDVCGDYHFSKSLARCLVSRGESVEIQELSRWDEPQEADVVLVLRGLFKYIPKRDSKTVYIMWNISHPDDVTDDEYNSYDMVFVSSMYYSKLLGERLKVPVYPLLQCTDTSLFYLSNDERNLDRNGLLFIGNARREGRLCVNWAASAGEPLRVYGKYWEKYLDRFYDYVVDTSIKNESIRSEYIHARATLNDHWSNMKGYQFINNRIFDALACGLPVISDSFDELREMFPEGVLHYEDRDSFMKCLEDMHDHYDEILKQAENARQRVINEHTFDRRAEELIARVNEYQTADKA